MGTFVEVISCDKRAFSIVFDEIARVEKLLSIYNPDSEISQLNSRRILHASPDTVALIKKAKEFCERSNGAFDVTVGSLMELWGFSSNKPRVPQEKDIKHTLRLVGSDKIVLNDTDNVIKFKLSGVRIDLGGIAKGYALDCAVKKLKARGINSCLINLGGQIYALGDHRGKPWRVGIQDPRGRGVLGYCDLKNRSAATSGDYQRFFFENKQRYSHILDPRTGYPADSGLLSVTVIASDGITADALSTAVFVLGKDKGQDLLKRFPGSELKLAVEEETVGESRRE